MTEVKFIIKPKTDEDYKEEAKWDNIHELCWEYANKHKVKQSIDFFDDNDKLKCPSCDSRNIGIEGYDNTIDFWCYDCGTSNDAKITVEWLYDIYDDKTLCELIGYKNEPC